MALSARRRRASTLTAAEPVAAEIQAQLAALAHAPAETTHKELIDEFHTKIAAGQWIRQSLLESSASNQTRDFFRHLHGFHLLIAAFKDATSTPSLLNLQLTDFQVFLDLAQTLFAILSAALQDHRGNQKYFRREIQGSGWDALCQICQTLFIKLRSADSIIQSVMADRIFGCLLACAFNDETLTESFKKARKQIKVKDPRVESQGQAQVHHARDEPGVANQRQDNGGQLDGHLVWQDVDSLAIVQNPESLSVMLRLWKMIPGISESSNAAVSTVSCSVPGIVSEIATMSTHNLAALHRTNALSFVLPCLLDTECPQSTELSVLAAKLLELGISNLEDAFFLYSQASTSPTVADILLQSLKTCSSPSYIHFDISLHGFASIELPAIGRTFPPALPSSGYTLSLWFYVVDFDPKSHTTLFGAFDSSQTCFVLIYLEKDSRNLILQTSVTSSRPSIRFKSTSFISQRWYHISIVHRRPKSMQPSKASLFVNGSFLEQVKAHFPESPPLKSHTSKSSPSTQSSQKSNPVQAFLGTPQDLATRPGKGLVNSKWRLASAHLFGETLNDELIAVHYQLGPRYSGNYQDCLGSFQTYEASAALNLRNEMLHPGKEEKSDIVTAIRSKAGTLLPEYTVLLNISPGFLLEDDDNGHSQQSELIGSLSSSSKKNLRNILRGGRTLVVNGAIPSIDEALRYPFGYTVLTGEPCVLNLQSLDSAAWRIGGCAGVGLSILDAAQDNKSVIRALEIVFQSVRESWRNSEAMERENGFGVLANLLADKLGPGSITTGISNPNNAGIDEASPDDLTLELLKLTLDFIGFRADNPEDSAINNPLAYRVLLLDFGHWRGASPQVQKLYYEQFVVFAVNSKSHLFNLKRLSKMRKS